MQANQIILCFTYILTFIFAAMCTIGDYWVTGTKNSNVGVWKECGYNNETIVCREIRILDSENAFLPTWLWISRLFAVFGTILPIFAIVFISS